MQEKWIILNKKGDFEGMAKELSLDPLTARILANRDVRDVATARAYLKGTPADLPDPALLRDAEKAASLLADALRAGQKIAVASDYDVDGVFAGQILKESLEALGASVKVFAPDRVTEGYGVNRRIVDDAAAFGVGLIVTCDNGIAAEDAVTYAKEQGLAVIVTDHHEVPEKDGLYTLPPADAVIDPKRPDCGYPYAGICGAVVALKLAQLLYRKLGRDETALLREMMPYAAVATVADLMELREENRIIVREGLESLPGCRNQGLQAMMRELGLTDKKLTPYHIGFIIGPCFNAAGRLETADLAQELLGEKDAARATGIAARLIELNKKRQNLTEEGAAAADLLVQEMAADKVLVLHLPDLHESIAGIVAGRIKEKYNRPALVVTGRGDACKGSARSIAAYPLFEKMKECADLFTRFGGHALAAGFSLPEKNIDILRRKMNENSHLTDEDLCPIIKLDAAMPPEYASAERIREWDSLGPFGNGFERPLFGRSNLTVSRITVLGQKRNALRLRFEGESGRSFEGIWFGDVTVWENFFRTHYGEKAFTMLERSQMKVKMALAYQPMLHEYGGLTGIQFQIRHFQAVT
nr:single-stranded-DNA-specific exonuclease RecJ [Lachnospiraceae bacterium]